MLTTPQKQTGVQSMLRIVEAFVVVAGVAFWIHGAFRADAGYELVALLLGLLAAALILPVGAIIQFRRHKAESAGVALVFLVLAIMIGWSVLSRLAVAKD
jgi:hypothetical protein